MKNKDIVLERCLSDFPLRIAITDYCNLRCFFCSNEGMPLCQKNKQHIDFKKLKKLISILTERGLKKISLTGGEPTLHPEIYKIINFLKRFKFKELYLHTNGSLLSRELLEKSVGSFTKIAISVHSVNFASWQKITSGAKQQFDRIMKNIELASSYKNKFLVELKYVPVKGWSDSDTEFSDFLELCSLYKLKFKFLNFEIITKAQEGLSLPFNEVKKKLLSLGCQEKLDEKIFRGQSRYLPIKRLKYKNVFGVAIEIGCGEPKVCEECYLSNEIFLTPQLEIKPCHASNYKIDLNQLIDKKDSQSIFNAIVDSRKFLATAPGLGKKTWQ